MDNIKICRTTPTDGIYQLHVTDLIERDNELVISLDNNECYSINEGDILVFIRTVYKEDGSVRKYTSYVTVKSEDENHVIHTTLVQPIKTYLYDGNWSEFYYDEETSHYIIYCRGEHYLFAQDLAIDEAQELYFKDYDGNLLYTFSGISAMQRYTRLPLTIEDCITKEEKDKTCGKNFEYITNRYYEFLPNVETENSFILDDFVGAMVEDAFYFETKFNPYYYYTIELNDKGVPCELDRYGNPVKHCHFYGDVWSDSLVDTQRVKYIRNGASYSGLFENRDYYSVLMTMYSEADETNLGGDEMFSESFAKNIEDSLIPDFIDMERVKYSPYRKIAENIYLPVTQITIYPHFRERVLLDLENNTNTLATSGNVYADGWYIDTDYNGIKYWNDYDWSGGFSDFNNFMADSGKTADLIGFLNFTDKDVYYRKHKVSKSFYRFSFYTSKDPIEQKLLFYSTVFVDSTELFSKYVKQFMYIEDNEGITDESDENYIVINDTGKVNGKVNQNTKTVFCENNNVGCRLDTKVTITNEYDKTRSAEGFNIYLFLEDAPEGNVEKTIYMRVDFNHAGNGKTIPMIMWPKNATGGYIPVTVDNFIDSLYIPIDIREYDGKYVYTIRNAEYDTDGNIELVLLEPKLEFE